jgi:DNA ligase (NAD+)
VTRKSNYLVLGKEPGQKYQKAKEIGIKILGENDFREMLKKR